MEKENPEKRVEIRVVGGMDGFVRASYTSRRQVPRRDFFDMYGAIYGSQRTSLRKPANNDKPEEVAENDYSFNTAAQIEPSNQSLVALAEESPQPLIDLNLPGEGSVYNRGFRFKQPVMPKIKTWGFRLASTVVIITIISGGLFFLQSFMTLHKVLRGSSKTIAALQTNVNPDLLKGEGDGRINILLLGRGGGNHDGPDLTDTMMLASIDPINDSVTLLSIPRDLWVDVPNQGAMKINATWETGEFNYEHKIEPGSTNPNAIQAGYNEVDQVVENVLGVTIDYNMIVDFTAFQQAVDTIGGITIDVPSELYDPSMAWENGNNPILAQAGLQTFTGSQALNYVRSRETTSDFARSQRQRAMLVAIKQKAETLGVVSDPFKIAGLFKALGDNVDTDIGLSDADKLYNLIKNVQPSSVASIGLADAPNNYVTTSWYGDQSIDIPTAGMFDYSAIQAYVRGQLQDPYIIKEKASVLILNGTTEPGLATSTANTLKTYGYDIGGVSNAPTSDYNQTLVIDLSHGKDKYTANYLDQRFNTTTLTSLPDKSIQTNGADFVIILGNDETVNSQG